MDHRWQKPPGGRAVTPGGNPMNNFNALFEQDGPGGQGGVTRGRLVASGATIVGGGSSVIQQGFRMKPGRAMRQNAASSRSMPLEAAPSRHRGFVITPGGASPGGEGGYYAPPLLSLPPHPGGKFSWRRRVRRAGVVGGTQTNRVFFGGGGDLLPAFFRLQHLVAFEHSTGRKGCWAKLLLSLGADFFPTSGGM